ncbi:hypothetical protein KR215_005148, partial [Drosophila sulfurigaster]
IHLQQLSLLWALLAVLPAARAVLSPSRAYDDENTSLQLSLEDLEREQEQQQQQLQQPHPFDLNRPPLLPNHYEWHPSVAASVPPSYVHDAAQLEQAERLRQLHLQHQQLSAGYALPSHLPDSLLLLATTPTAATTTTTTAAAIKSGTRLLQPIVPFDLDLQLQLNGVQYLNDNALPRPLPRLVPRPLRPPYTYVQQQQQPIRSTYNPPPSQLSPIPPQSKQFAYAPLPQRNYATAPRIPLPYPPSFISITTRRPGATGYSSGYAKPFRPSQPDPTPDLFAGRESKSLLDSYIPSWEVLRLLQQHQQSRPVQRHTLAYAVPSMRLFKRNSKGVEGASEERRIVKKSLPSG